MAQRTRKPEEQQQTQELRLQIPARTAQSSASTPTTVREIPNGFELELRGGTKIRITSDVTPTQQMINLTISFGSPSAAPSQQRRQR